MFLLFVSYPIRWIRYPYCGFGRTYLAPRWSSFSIQRKKNFFFLACCFTWYRPRQEKAKGQGDFPSQVRNQQLPFVRNYQILMFWQVGLKASQFVRNRHLLDIRRHFPFCLVKSMHWDQLLCWRWLLLQRGLKDSKHELSLATEKAR